MYAVSGASGKLGRLVIDHLLTLIPPQQIIATTRTPQALADLAAKGVVVRQADFADPANLPAAFRDVTRLLLISTPVQRIDHHIAAINAAVSAGVGHIVYTSGIGADPTSSSLISQVNGVTEAALAATPYPGRPYATVTMPISYPGYLPVCSVAKRCSSLLASTK